MFTCPGCGVQLPNGIPFCPTCNRQFPRHQSTTDQVLSELLTPININQWGRLPWPFYVVGLIILIVMVARFSLLNGNLSFADQRVGPGTVAPAWSIPSTSPPAGSGQYGLSEPIAVTVEQLMADKDDRYRFQSVAVTGIVARVFAADKDPEIVFQSGWSMYPGVACTFDPKYRSQLLQLSPGMRITVHGTCSNSGNYAQLTDCTPN